MIVHVLIIIYLLLTIAHMIFITSLSITHAFIIIYFYFNYSYNNHYATATAIILRGTGERNRGYALLMKANKSETVLYRAPTFSLLLVSHGGISSYVIYTT